VQVIHPREVAGVTSAEVWAGAVRRVLRERAGIDVVAMTPTRSGESGAAFWITDRSGAVMLLKVISGLDATGHLRRVDAVAARLRERGYPAPRCRFIGFIGQAAGTTLWVQERLPGSPLEGDHGRPGPAAVTRLLDQLIRLNDAQAGLGDGRPGWPELITSTLTSGGTATASTPPCGTGPIRGTCWPRCAGSASAAARRSRRAATSSTSTSALPTCSATAAPSPA
jgi:hypothetical protein